MTLRTRNNRLVTRGGKLVPGCNECPPCVFVPRDPCDESEIQFGINDSGTLSIDRTVTWGASQQFFEESIGKPFRVHYPSLPTIRFRVELDIIDITSSVSGTNSMFGQMLLNHTPFTEPANLARPGVGADSRFAGLNIIKNVNGSPTDQSISYIPNILESEISVISVFPTSATSGTATIERKIWGFATTQFGPHVIVERTGPTITTVELSYSCDSWLVFRAVLRGGVIRALGIGVPPTIEPYLRADLHWEVEVSY